MVVSPGFRCCNAAVQLNFKLWHAKPAFPLYEGKREEREGGEVIAASSTTPSQHTHLDKFTKGFWGAYPHTYDDSTCVGSQ